jgi:hypothetical protein
MSLYWSLELDGLIPRNTKEWSSELGERESSYILIPRNWLSDSKSQFHVQPNDRIQESLFQFPILCTNTYIQTGYSFFLLWNM